MSLESRVASSGFGGDAVTTAARQSDGGSAQEQLAKMQILMLKHQAHSKKKSGDAAEREYGELFGNLSEVEMVAVDILKGLGKYPESSAEACQVAQQTGTTDRYEQAMWIATRVVEQQRAGMFMSLYAGDKDEVRGQFLGRQEIGIKARKEKLKNYKARSSETARSMADVIVRGGARLLTGGGGSAATDSSL